MKTGVTKTSAKKSKKVNAVKLSAAAEAEVIRFLEFHPPARLGRNLRNLLMEFLMYDGGTEAVFLKELLYDLTGLYDLLDCLEREGGAGQFSDRIENAKPV